MADQAGSAPGSKRTLVTVVIGDSDRRARVTSAIEAADVKVLDLDSIEAIGSTPDIDIDIDLVITDHVGADGQIGDALQSLLTRRAPPVVIITPNRLAGVESLEAGAADFVVEPFDARELRARALLRAGAIAPLTLEYGDLRIDLGARVVSVGGVPLDLPPREFELLAFLATRPGRVFSREELLGAVWGALPHWQRTDTVTEHVYRLRRHLEPDSSLITTVRGAGYRFDP